jgi:hypothetical protein
MIEFPCSNPDCQRKLQVADTLEAKGIEIIRNMKSIRHMATATNPQGDVGMSPRQFWDKYDAGEFK